MAPISTPAPDDLEGCDISGHEDDVETAELRALFPAGAADVHLADEWRAVFAADVGGAR